VWLSSTVIAHLRGSRGLRQRAAGTRPSVPPQRTGWRRQRQHRDAWASTSAREDPGRRAGGAGWAPRSRHYCRWRVEKMRTR